MIAGKAWGFGRGLRLGAILFPFLVALLFCRGGVYDFQNERAAQNSGESAALETKQAPHDLLPTLRVTGDSCYAHIEPNTDSLYFGPLVGGERVKRLDSEEDWLLIWIPRLRISGWVRGGMVSAATEEVELKEPVPYDVMTSVTVISREINIRQSPTTGSLVMGTGKHGEEFWLLNEKNGWLQVWVARLARAGWVYGELVTKNRR